MRTPLIAPLLALATTLALAADPAALRVDAPYLRVPPPGAAATGAFMRIDNGGSSERQLVRAESPAAETVELHTHLNENGMMKMRAVPAIPIPAGGHTELKPGSYHVMLIGMKRPLQAGDIVPITLRFDDGTQIRVDAPARPIHAEGMMHGGMKH